MAGVKVCPSPLTLIVVLITHSHYRVTVRPMLRERCPVCLSVLSVTLVYCGQTVGWIKMPLGTEVASAQAVLCSIGTELSPHGNWHIGPPHISAHFALARSPISATAELLLRYASGQTNTHVFRHGHHNTSQCYQGGEWGRSKNKQGINITYFCVSESCRYWRSL